MRSWVALASALALLAGCQRRPPGEAEGGKAAGSPVPITLTTTTSDGRYRVSAAPEKGSIPLNEHVALDVTVTPAAAGATSEGLSLSVDADMPSHRHGINVRPSVTTAAGAGRFRVEGLLLHMPGEWELYLDVTPPVRGASASRATFALRLE